MSYDLVCFSHLRWNFVYQRPQHLLSRFARTHRVFFIEEPSALTDSETQPRLDISRTAGGPTVVVPRVPATMEQIESEAIQRHLLAELFTEAAIRDFVLWYYTPMAVGLTGELPAPLTTVYDCMDQLSAFQGAPPDLLQRETELFAMADLVFTGGQTLYEAKRYLHPRVFEFPSCVDVAHFGKARRSPLQPIDQAQLVHPRLGFCGVLDERLDSGLLADVAALRPEWQFVLIGPVAKIEPRSLPQRDNIHYLGPRPYNDLPSYLAGWDVALIPFAHNAATEFISPTKTPEYLAAGRPVVSTSIRDVVRPYRAAGLVHIADEPAEFVAAAEAAMGEDAGQRQDRADRLLATMSWDRTWSKMSALVDESVSRRSTSSPRRLAAALA